MPRTIALLIETSSAYGRGILGGIVRYRRAFPGWTVTVEQGDLGERPPRWLTNWRGDGIITRTMNSSLLELAERSNVPVVNVSDREAGPPLPEIRSDDRRIGALVATHLADRRYRHLAFAGFDAEIWSARRRDGFVSVARERGLLIPDERAIHSGPWRQAVDRDWVAERTRLERWLLALPKPVGVMGCNDVRGRQILDACKALTIRVPEEIGVVGVDDDALLCQFCDPPLSSVVPDTETIGYLACERLAALMDGVTPDPIGPGTVAVPPLGLRIRQSSDTLVVEDERLADAVRTIRLRACDGLTVSELVDEVGIPRSTLERRFRSEIGRSPQQEIRRVRVRRVKELLERTSLRIADIAIRCGFENPEYLYVLFKRMTGQTPAAYRDQARSGDRGLEGGIEATEAAADPDVG